MRLRSEISSMQLAYFAGPTPSNRLQREQLNGLIRTAADRTEFGGPGIDRRNVLWSAFSALNQASLSETAVVSRERYWGLVLEKTSSIPPCEFAEN